MPCPALPMPVPVSLSTRALTSLLEPMLVSQAVSLVCWLNLHLSSISIDHRRELAWSRSTAAGLLTFSRVQHLLFSSISISISHHSCPVYTVLAVYHRRLAAAPCSTV